MDQRTGTVTKFSDLFCRGIPDGATFVFPSRDRVRRARWISTTPPARSYERLPSKARLLSPHPYYPPDPDLHGSHVCLRCRIIYPHEALSAEHLHTTTHILRRGKSGDCNADAEPPRSSGRKMDFYARLAMPLSPFSGHRTKLKHSGSHSYTTIY